MSEEIALPSGEILPLGVDLSLLDQSVHGRHAAQGVYCTDCHQDRRRYQYPHEPNPAESLAQFVAEIANNCEQCHVPLELHNPGHLEAADNANLPNCVNCHGGHTVVEVEEFAADPVAMCLGCHESFDEPAVAAVHAQFGENLLPDQNCQTCHDDQVNATLDTECKNCHTMVTEPVSEVAAGVIDPHVDPLALENSVHRAHEIQGQPFGPIQCTDCHSDLERYEFPHELPAEISPREMRIAAEETCRTCHEHVFDIHQDSIHAEALARGELEAATCIDCHGSHEIQDPDEPRERISHTCGQCHNAVFEVYAESVHGAALLGEQNPDVAVCTDCHGVHQIPDPTTAEFRVHSPQLCAQCHADTEMMAKYDISTDVFETYVADFHGTTVTLFEKQAPDQETNAAVCYDCHGIHNILPVTDENSHVLKENLLTTCRQCHPSASTNFPDSWMSHFEPSWEHNRIVFLVDWFYKLLIPTVVGGFLLYIGTDVFHRYVRRRDERKQGEE
jgi:predicted CXXCH cytochrome family protein